MNIMNVYIVYTIMIYIFDYVRKVIIYICSPMYVFKVVGKCQCDLLACQWTDRLYIRTRYI